MAELEPAVDRNRRFVFVTEGEGPAEGRCLRVVVEGRGVVICRSGGRLLAVSDRCPHNGLSLHDGSLKDGVLTCRWHGWAFELTTGLPPGADPADGGPRVRTYPVRQEQGRIWLELPGDPAMGGGRR